MASFLNAHIHEQISDRIITLLKQRTVPWQKPWKARTGLPRNLVSQKSHRGINVILLLVMSYESPCWLTSADPFLPSNPPKRVLLRLADRGCERGRRFTANSAGGNIRPSLACSRRRKSGQSKPASTEARQQLEHIIRRIPPSVFSGATRPRAWFCAASTGRGDEQGVGPGWARRTARLFGRAVSAPERFESGGGAGLGGRRQKCRLHRAIFGRGGATPRSLSGHPAEVSPSKRRLVPLLLTLVVWFGVVGISVEAWYRWHEIRMPSATLWTMSWPTHNPTFKTAVLSDRTRNCSVKMKAAAWLGRRMKLCGRRCSCGGIRVARRCIWHKTTRLKYT